MKPTFTAEEQHAMAARDFPAEYEAAKALTGKPRQRTFRKLRDRAVYRAQMAALPAGARCGACKHLEPSPCHGIGQHCGIDSDHNGYAVVKSSFCCPDWTARLEVAA